MFKIFITGILSLPMLVGQPNPTGSIRGGKAVSGVIVTAVLNARPPFSGTSTSAADGSFQIPNLPAGPYVLCPQVRGGGYVDPCQWSLTPPTATVANGQVSAGNVVKIQKGSIVKIRMQDSNRQMAQKTRDGRQPHLLIGVPTPRGLFSPAHLAAKDSNGADFEVTVPLDKRVTVSVISRDLKLGDDRGAPLANNRGRESLLHASGDPSPKRLSYTVLGQLP